MYSNILYSQNLHKVYVEIKLSLDSRTILDISSKLTLNLPSSVLNIKLLFFIEILLVFFIIKCLNIQIPPNIFNLYISN